MIELEIQEGLWNDFTTAARRLGTPPQALVEELLRGFVQRAADEELLASSEQSARGARFRADDAEELVRSYRRRSS
jgi:hypothetical protein